MKTQATLSRIDLEPVGGIAGDMFAAAMFSGFPHFYQDFSDDLKCLGIDGLTVELEDRLSNGLQAKYFSVIQNTTNNPPRTLSEVKTFFANSPLSETVSRHTVGIFTKLAAAEAEVHGKSIETIHFHEVSDWDSVVDILAAAGIIARVDCPLWRVGALPLGGGTVKTAHGEIPVPAPATTALLKDFQWHDDGIGGERVTPTGAAILAFLKATSRSGKADAASLVSTGSGCGSKAFEGHANILRMTAFSNGNASSSLRQDELMRIAFEVDDMTAEEIAWAVEKLRAASGVHDVSCIAMQGKKNRSSTGYRILVSNQSFDNVVQQAFVVTSTIGVRYSSVNRYTLKRSDHELTTTAGNSTQVKLAERPGETVSAKTASDDLQSAESLIARRQLAQMSADAALNKHNTDVPK